MMWANVDVELDVVFKDTTVQCRYLYVISLDRQGTGDTIAIFDTLSFKRHEGVSLFYSVENDETNILVIIDTAGMVIQSKPFRILSGKFIRNRNVPAVFTVVIGKEQIAVANKKYRYLESYENKSMYFVFMLLFITVKLLIAISFSLLSELHRRIILIASGAFLFTALMVWFIPLYHIYRLFITIFTEYLLIAVIGRKYISWLLAAILILIVNLAGFGIITLMYIFYVFL